MTAVEFNKCVDLYADNIYRFILKNIKDKEKAKDIVQDTYEKLWLKVNEVESINAKSYMFTTAYRTMIDVIRREKFKGDYDETKVEALKVSNTYKGEKDALNIALEKLPEIQIRLLGDGPEKLNLKNLAVSPVCLQLKDI